MTLQIDTTTGNKEPSQKLKQMLTDLKSNAGAVASWLDRVEEIRHQAHEEGFDDEQTKLLLRHYLSGFLKKRRVEWILTDKPRIEKQKKLMEKHRINATDANVPINEPETVNIPTDYNVIIPQDMRKRLNSHSRSNNKKVLNL